MDSHELCALQLPRVNSYSEDVTAFDATARHGLVEKRRSRPALALKRHLAANRPVLTVRFVRFCKLLSACQSTGSAGQTQRHLGASSRGTFPKKMLANARHQRLDQPMEKITAGPPMQRPGPCRLAGARRFGLRAGAQPPLVSDALTCRPHGGLPAYFRAGLRSRVGEGILAQAMLGRGSMREAGGMFAVVHDAL